MRVRFLFGASSLCTCHLRTLFLFANLCWELCVCELGLRVLFVLQVVRVSLVAAIHICGLCLCAFGLDKCVCGCVAPFCCCSCYLRCCHLRISFVGLVAVCLHRQRGWCEVYLRVSCFWIVCSNRAHANTVCECWPSATQSFNSGFDDFDSKI